MVSGQSGMAVWRKLFVSTLRVSAKHWKVISCSTSESFSDRFWPLGFSKKAGVATWHPLLASKQVSSLPPICMPRVAWLFLSVWIRVMEGSTTLVVLVGTLGHAAVLARVAAPRLALTG